VNWEGNDWRGESLREESNKIVYNVYIGGDECEGWYMVGDSLSSIWSTSRAELIFGFIGAASRARLF
jgi:hypothetical protein